MRWIAAALVSIFILATSHSASAEIGYVIESRNAKPAVGAPVEAETALEIPSDGYLVILTANGRVLRRNGPFAGPAGGLFERDASASDADASGDIIAAIVDLARKEDTSTSRVLAIRNTGLKRAATSVFAITPAIRSYCAPRDGRGEFALQAPSARDMRITISPLSDPSQTMEASWRAGSRTLSWPENWEPLEAGSYLWRVGRKQATFTVVEHNVDFDLLDNSQLAYEFKRLGCAEQASRAFAKLVDDASVIQ